MTDMLVPLYGNPLLEPGERDGAVDVRRPLAGDSRRVLDFVQAHFGTDSPGWVDECRLALMQQPGTCHVALAEGQLAGFCCYDTTARGMFGPLGVAAAFRCRGIGGALLRESLRAMREAGYAYAVIGWVSDEDFYREGCGATVITGSSPGIYARLIKF